MAPKHDEVVRHLSGGWTVAWDANAVEPATRKAFDKVIADNARALREVLHDTSHQAAPPAAKPAGRSKPAHGRGSRRVRVAG